jgi:hypothetical protein
MHSVAYSIDRLMAIMIAELVCVIRYKERSAFQRFFPRLTSSDAA